MPPNSGLLPGTRVQGKAARTGSGIGLGLESTFKDKPPFLFSLFNFCPPACEYEAEFQPRVDVNPFFEIFVSLSFVSSNHVTVSKR